MNGLAKTVVGALALACSGTVTAQTNVAQGYLDMSSGLMQTSMFNTVMRSAAELRTRPGKASKSAPTRLNVGRATPLTYTESPAVTARVKRNFVAFLRRQGLDDGAASMESYLAKNDFRADWAKAAAGDGLKRGSALDALTEYWLTNWLIANGKTTNNTRTQAQGLRRQLAPVMASNPTFAKLTNAQRQEIAEIWMINAVAQAGGYLTAVKSGDQAMVRRASEAARSRFRNEVKIDLRNVTLTDGGFARA